RRRGGTRAGRHRGSDRRKGAVRGARERRRRASAAAWLNRTPQAMGCTGPREFLLPRAFRIAEARRSSGVRSSTVSSRSAYPRGPCSPPPRRDPEWTYGSPVQEEGREPEIALGED